MDRKEGHRQNCNVKCQSSNYKEGFRAFDRQVPPSRSGGIGGVPAYRQAGRGTIRMKFPFLVLMGWPGSFRFVIDLTFEFWHLVLRFSK
jgi:hypothetical protein